MTDTTLLIKSLSVFFFFSVAVVFIIKHLGEKETLQGLVKKLNNAVQNGIAVCHQLRPDYFKVTYKNRVFYVETSENGWACLIERGKRSQCFIVDEGGEDISLMYELCNNIVLAVNNSKTSNNQSKTQ